MKVEVCEYQWISKAQTDIRENIQHIKCDSIGFDCSFCALQIGMCSFPMNGIRYHSLCFCLCWHFIAYLFDRILGETHVRSECFDDVRFLRLLFATICFKTKSFMPIFRFFASVPLGFHSCSLFEELFSFSLIFSFFCSFSPVSLT